MCSPIWAAACCNAGRGRAEAASASGTSSHENSGMDTALTSGLKGGMAPNKCSVAKLPTKVAAHCPRTACFNPCA